ncbi:MAG: hypothetical protein PHF46_05060 [Candidatus Gracilibacteria bacterium]|nr:hypothetical protein [Candidatus Gracilibacteria bacterium]MDD3120747.1 hypothetical protein [Candidatus Gracilibacteria bacterium]MDD4530982.1 hypothetical protein [Candidatus Gracilibacteria bacterium]
MSLETGLSSDLLKKLYQVQITPMFANVQEIINKNHSFAFRGDVTNIIKEIIDADKNIH